MKLFLTKIDKHDRINKNYDKNNVQKKSINSVYMAISFFGRNMTELQPNFFPNFKILN